MLKLNYIISGSALAVAIAGSSVASAQQPLPITVNPFAVPGQVVNTAVGLPGQVFTDPFGVPRTIIAVPLGVLGVDTSGPVINERAAKAAAVNDVSTSGEAVVSTGALPSIGPRYINPARARYQRPLVLQVGSTVPSYVTLEPATNISVPGLVANAEYSYFVTERNRVVLVDPATRTVVRIVRT